MFEYDTVNRWVFRRLWKVSSDGADVTSGGRLFQTSGPATGKALSPTVDRMDCGWMRRLVLAKWRARRLGKSATRTNWPRYDGAKSWRTLYVSTATLNWMHCGMRIYWQTATNGHVHKLNLGDPDQSRAISSGARRFVNYLWPINSAFIWCETIQLIGFDPSKKCDKGAMPICLHFIRAK